MQRLCMVVILAIGVVSAGCGTTSSGNDAMPTYYGGYEYYPYYYYYYY